MKINLKTDIWNTTDPEEWKKKYNNLWDIILVIITVHMTINIILYPNLIITIFDSIWIILYIIKQTTYNKHKNEQETKIQ